MTILAVQPVGHQAEKNLVGYELALVHVLGRLGAEGGPTRLMVAKDVAGRDLRHAVASDDLSGLRPLTCARRAKQDDGADGFASCCHALPGATAFDSAGAWGKAFVVA